MEKSQLKSRLKGRSFARSVQARSNIDSSTVGTSSIEPQVNQVQPQVQASQTADNFKLEYDLKYMEYQKSLYLRIKAKKALQNIKNDIQAQFLGMNELLEQHRKANAELHYAAGCMKMLQKLEETTPKLGAVLYPLSGEFDGVGKKLEDIEAACCAASHIMPKQLQESLAKFDNSHVTVVQTALNEINETMCIERVNDLDAIAKAMQNVCSNSKKLTEETTRSTVLLQEADELFEEESSLIFDTL